MARCVSSARSETVTLLSVLADVTVTVKGVTSGVALTSPAAFLPKVSTFVFARSPWKATVKTPPVSLTSTSPTPIAVISGPCKAFVMSVIMFLGIGVYAFSRLVLNQPLPAGFASLAILTMTGIILNAMFLGIIGEYLGRMERQRRNIRAYLYDENLQELSGRQAPQGGDALVRDAMSTDELAFVDLDNSRLVALRLASTGDEAFVVLADLEWPVRGGGRASGRRGRGGEDQPGEENTADREPGSGRGGRGDGVLGRPGEFRAEFSAADDQQRRRRRDVY